MKEATINFAIQTLAITDAERKALEDLRKLQEARARSAALDQQRNGLLKQLEELHTQQQAASFLCRTLEERILAS